MFASDYPGLTIGFGERIIPTVAADVLSSLTHSYVLNDDSFGCYGFTYICQVLIRLKYSSVFIVLLTCIPLNCSGKAFLQISFAPMLIECVFILLNNSFAQLRL